MVPQLYTEDIQLPGLMSRVRDVLRVLVPRLDATRGMNMCERIKTRVYVEQVVRAVSRGTRGRSSTEHDRWWLVELRQLGSRRSERGIHTQTSRRNQE